MPEEPKHSTLSMTILAMLTEAPMHPYRMQQLIRERAKDDVVNVGQRASLYKAIQRLLREGLVEERETSRDGARPERTVYALTAAGDQVCRGWLRDALATPAREYPQFPAAISFLALLRPDEVRSALEQRRERLGDRRAQMQAQAVTLPIPRLFILEDEYRIAVLGAEIEWLEAVVRDLDAGVLTWSLEWLREVAARLGSKADG